MHNDEVGIVTRSGERRLRWLAAAVALPLFGVVAAFGTVEHVPEPVRVRTVIEPLALSATPVGDSGTIIYFQEDRFRRSDTLATLIERLGADEDEAATFLRSSRATRPFRLLLPGTTVQAKVDEVGKLRSISFLTDRDTILSVDRVGESFGRFEQPAEVARGVEMKSGEIETSLFAAICAAGPVLRSFLKLSTTAAKRSDPDGCSRPNSPAKEKPTARYGFRIPGEGAAITPRTARTCARYFYARRSNSRVSPRDSACAAIRFSSSGARIRGSTMGPRSEQGSSRLATVSCRSRGGGMVTETSSCSGTMGDTARTTGT